MPIRFTCKNCQSKFTVPDSAAGKTAKCKSCSQPIKIPQGSASNPTADASATAKAKATGAAAPKLPATYEITSAINGAVFGPADRKTLNQWVKEERITPDCKIKQVGTSKWMLASKVFPSLKKFAAEDGANVAPVNAQTGSVGVPAVGNSDSSSNPFAAIGADTRPSASNAINPYVSSKSSRQPTADSRPVVPTKGRIGFIIDHTFKQYGDNFGVLLGATAMFIGIFIAIGVLFVVVMQVAIGSVAAGGGFRNEAAIGSLGIGVIIVMAILYLVCVVLGTYLGIGFARLTLKIGRGLEANVTDIFDAGGRFLPVLGFGAMYLIFMFVVLAIFGFVANVTLGANPHPRVAIALFAVLYLFLGIVLSMIWPAYFLVVDGKSKVINSFSLGLKVGAKNILPTFVIFAFASIIYLLGALFIGIGLLFTLPIAFLLISVSYLNMTGQISEQSA